MHITLDQLNAILEGTATAHDRCIFTDHLLECSACTDKFKMFHQLHQEMSEEKKAVEPAAKVLHFPLRHILGAAAVMAMCITPYLTKNQDKSQPASEMEMASAPPEFNILQDVKKLNYKAAIDKWGQEITLTDLVAMSNEITPNK